LRDSGQAAADRLRVDPAAAAPASRSGAAREPLAAASTSGSSSSTRRPLSSWSPAPPVTPQFQPALEVDGFAYSAVCRSLTTTHRDAWTGVLEAVVQLVESGATLVGIAGARRGAGGTTAAACLGKLLAEQGLQTALLDGDFSGPGLAETLGVAVEIGWEDVLAGRVGLAECMIRALDDGVAAAPLAFGGEPAAEKLDGLHAAVTAGILRYHYDVTLVDLGPLDLPRQVAAASRIARQCRLDGMLLVDNDPAAAGAGAAWLAAAAPELAALYLGDVQNFAIAG
jgi:Mrp family chromosome partitioning ATPase